MDLRGDPFIPNFFLNFMLCLAVASCGGSAGPSNQPLLDTSAGPATKPLFNSNPIIIEDAASYYSHACNDPSFQFLIPLNINDDEHIFSIPETGYSTPETYDGMTLVWSDEFDGPGVNTNNWSFEIGTGTWGWGNNELQYLSLIHI